jgi:hypothetical protein
MYSTGLGMPSPATCTLCPSNNYCHDGYMYACPNHTASVSNSTTPMDCTCLRGYFCVPVRRVGLTLAANLSDAGVRALADRLRRV